jgi:hypothetical protein
VSRFHRVGTAALVLAGLAAGRVVTGAFDSTDAINAPYLRAGALGRPVDLRYAAVTATRVDGSPCVSTGSGVGSEFRTAGVFLVVRLTIVTKKEPAEVRYAALTDRQGRTFLTSSVGRSSFSPGVGQPGVPRYASAVVEVPRDAVAGAHLRIALNSLDQRRDDMADIDLGLTATQAAEWATARTEVPVTPPSDQPPASNPAAAGCPGPA